MYQVLEKVTDAVGFIQTPTREDLDFLNMTGRKMMWQQGFRGEGMKVAIIDTGINWNHPEFEGKTVEHYANVGYISEGMDDNGHGTHCAASICGNTVGVAPEADIVSYKILDNFGGLSTVSKLLWAMNEINARNDIDVVSMSIGVPERYFTSAQLLSFHNLVDSLNNKGCHVVCSAGNDGEDSTPKYPAYFENPIVVGATDENTEPSWFSSVHEEVDFCQVGYDVCSAWFEQVDGQWGYKKMSGTSMATPIIAGMIALIGQKYKAFYGGQMLNVDLFAFMNMTAIDLGTAGIDDKTGVGFFTFKDSLSVIEFDVDITNLYPMDIEPGTILFNGEEQQIEAKPIMTRDNTTGIWKLMSEVRSLFEKFGSTVIYDDGKLTIKR